MRKSRAGGDGCLDIQEAGNAIPMDLGGDCPKRRNYRMNLTKRKMVSAAAAVAGLLNSLVVVVVVGDFAEDCFAVVGSSLRLDDGLNENARFVVGVAVVVASEEERHGAFLMMNESKERKRKKKTKMRNRVEIK